MHRYRCVHEIPSLWWHICRRWLPSETALGLLGHLLRGLQEYIIGKDGQILTDPLPAYDAALIHEEERPPCYPTL